MLLARISHKPANFAHCISYVWPCSHHDIHETSNCQWVWNLTHLCFFSIRLWAIILWNFQICRQRCTNRLPPLHVETLNHFLYVGFLRQFKNSLFAISIDPHSKKVLRITQILHGKSLRKRLFQAFNCYHGLSCDKHIIHIKDENHQWPITEPFCV